jgi:hypothetical protein
MSTEDSSIFYCTLVMMVFCIRIAKSVSGGLCVSKHTSIRTNVC